MEIVSFILYITRRSNNSRTENIQQSNNKFSFIGPQYIHEQSFEFSVFFFRAKKQRTMWIGSHRQLVFPSSKFFTLFCVIFYYFDCLIHAEKVIYSRSIESTFVHQIGQLWIIVTGLRNNFQPKTIWLRSSIFLFREIEINWYIFIHFWKNLMIFSLLIDIFMKKCHTNQPKMPYYYKSYYNKDFTNIMS